MSEYLLLIYTNEATDPKPGTPEHAARNQAYGTFTQKLAQSGQMSGGNALQSIGTAKTVRVRNGESIVTAGPFAETAEQLGGYYLVNCDTMEQALEWAAGIPGAKDGSIEVRPILPM